jgi:hypothetical protein
VSHRLAAVVCTTGDLPGHAREELAPAAMVAPTAIPPVPPDAHPLARLPLWQMPHACTWIRTAPAPGSGTCRAMISRGSFRKCT